MQGNKRIRQRADRKGHLAEIMVMLFYMLRRYRLRARRLRYRQGEIDLVMARGAETVFIEVKFRDAATDTGDMEAALPGPRQQQRIRAAAATYMGRAHAYDNTARIDVVILRGWFDWRIYRNAF